MLEKKTINIVKHCIEGDTYNMPRRGGTCIVASHTTGDSFIRIATENCSLRDVYSKKIGRIAAEKNLAEGKCIRIGYQGRKTSVTHGELRYMVDSIFNFDHCK